AVATVNNLGLVSAVSAGSTTITYLDVNGCQQTEVVTILLLDDPSFILTPSCDGGTATITGLSGGTFTFNTPPVDAAVIDPVTGDITGGTFGTQYDVLYTTNGACPQTSTQLVTAISQDDPTFALAPTCDGATAVVTGLTGGTFTFTNAPADGAVIDPVTGEITGGTPGGSYDVTYTTNGACVATLDLMVVALASDDASFTMTPTCEGGIATVIGLPGGTFTFNIAPGDGATVDPINGIVTGGTPGATYNIMYTTSGACPVSSVESVTAYSLPLAPLAGTDATYCTDDLYADMTSNGGAGTFTWYDDAALTSVMGGSTTMQPYDLVGVNTYYVTETMNGCEGPESMVTITIQVCDIIIPTAFTPNGDTYNDIWEIVNLDNVYPNNVVWVYNRWGSLIYQSNPGQYSTDPWDGTFKGELQPVSSYYFIIEFNDDEAETAKGTVTILRNN
ncbi:MAG: gliding motility-associated C-terminal domain-containing protein, partial [Crocinitomicaceae bacterium]|nr:gliding motility-associated C-terminal domain-containing protein [Crocinitomicaceae bacterium]